MSERPTWWSDDDQLLAELGAAAREGDSVPQSLRRIGRAAWAWRTVDAELAQLQGDSSLAGAEPAGFRGDQPEGTVPSGPRMLSFAARQLALELELHPDAVRGQLIPPQAATVRVRREAGTDLSTEVAVDAVGWFVVAPAPTGRFRLQVRTEAGDAVTTDWIVP